jgi:NAD(P)-dependent dehydrogenase (short-subunit alcohol dehydrogenase family)
MKGRHKVLLLGAAASALMYWNEQRAKACERNLAGAVVAISGGSRRLGLALARELASEGCRIAICARDEDELEKSKTDIERHGAKVLSFVCDVTDRDQIESFARATSARFGQIDIWINNAAIIQIGPIEDMEVEDFKKTMDINFWGKVYGCYAVLPQMIERGNGHIVNINSLAGKLDCHIWRHIALQNSQARVSRKAC